MENELLALYAAERARLHAMACGNGRSGEYEAPVFGEGPMGPRLMLIGEAPGAEEAQLGHPFVGRAGKTLDALLDGAGIVRENIFVTNAVKFRPINIKARSISNRTPTPKELRESLPVLERELLLVKPQLIATLGNTPLRAMYLLAGADPVSIGDAHGHLWPLTICSMPLAVFPLYHPASVLYRPSLLPIVEMDVKHLGSILNKTEEAGS